MVLGLFQPCYHTRDCGMGWTRGGKGGKEKLFAACIMHML